MYDLLKLRVTYPTRLTVNYQYGFYLRVLQAFGAGAASVLMPSAY